MIRVLLADDHHLIRRGIRALLDGAPGIDVVGEAADGQEALDLVAQLEPDVLAIDIAMPRLDGLQALAQVQALNVPTRVIILSMYSDRALVQQALGAGAKGYLLKRSVAEELILAIHAASRGETYLSPEVSGAVVNGFLRESAADASMAGELTPREREVLQLIVEGRTNKEIASVLHISLKTVEKHRANVMSKLDVHDLVGLVRVAIQKRLVFIDD
jgi:DNA-binding NarL/FixJ family response regulator